jgi:hypothetical protein
VCRRCRTGGYGGCRRRQDDERDAGGDREGGNRRLPVRQAPGRHLHRPLRRQSSGGQPDDLHRAGRLVGVLDAGPISARCRAPSPALIYWRRPARDSLVVHTVPVGLQLIAGDDEAATAPQPTSVIAWTCSGGTRLRDATSRPHDCRAATMLRLVVRFPSCWDGRTLSGATQRDVVYRTAHGCPASHPVEIAQIVFHVT